MALVEHERDIGVLAVAAAADDLVQDAEQLERVRRPDDEVVVGVEARVEVERAELAEAQQLGDDELDVRAGRVVAGVEAHHRPVAERRDLHVAGAPVRNIGVVKSRLEELVLEHHPLVLTDARVDLRERIGEAVLAGRGCPAGPGSCVPSASQIFRSRDPIWSMMSMHSKWWSIAFCRIFGSLCVSDPNL